MATTDTGGEFENERKAGFPQGADALKSGDFLSPLMQLICCQPHRGEFATSITTSLTLVGNAAECATKRIDGMGEKPQCLYEAGVEPLGRSIQGYQLDVKELPLKGTGAARCRPPRGQAWLRDHRASTQSDERPTGKFPPASRPCTMGQQPCSEGESASF